MLCIVFVGVHLTDLQWKLIYVGSADNEDYDQVLEDVFVGPVNVGINQFVLQVCFHYFLFALLQCVFIWCFLMAADTRT